MLVVDFLHQLHAAAIVEPGILFRGDHAEGHGGEEHGVDILAFPVVGGRVPHLVLTGIDHVEDAERRFMLVGRVDADFHLAVGHLFDHVSHLDDRITEDREAGSPGLRELPTVLGGSLDIGPATRCQDQTGCYKHCDQQLAKSRHLCHVLSSLPFDLTLNVLPDPVRRAF